MQHMDEIREELRQPAIDLRGLIPDVMKGFGAMSSAAMAEGELSGAVKELLAVVIAITRECDGCIVAHTRGALRQGVTRQQTGRGDRRGDLAQRRTGHRVGPEGAALFRRGRGRPIGVVLEAVGQVLDAVDEA